MPYDADIVFLGGGPAGYVGAIHAAQAGLKTILVERYRPGGVCLFTGCIPSKALLDGAHHYARLKSLAGFGISIPQAQLSYPALREHARRVVEQNAQGIERYLLPRAGVELLRGEGRLCSREELEVRTPEGTLRLHPRALVLATGSRERWLKGWSPQPPYVVSTHEIFELEELPQRIAIVGGGVIGCEFSDLFVSLGREVTLFELTDTLIPGFDAELRKALLRTLRKKGVRVYLKSEVSPPQVAGGEVKLRAQGEERRFDLVLLAVGRVANAQGIGAVELGVQVDPQGFIPSSPQTYETNLPGIYSVGDLRGAPMLAHKASLEAVRCVDRFLGKELPKEPPIPAVVYTDPELASVGLSEEEARARGYPVTTGIFPLTASGRARASQETEGMIKVVGDERSGALLGVHIFAPHASEMIPFASLALSQELTREELLTLSYPHPTLVEGLYEALLLAFHRKAHHF